MKTVRICAVSDLENGQMKAFEINGQRILVSRIKDRFYATGADCPHYGGPLEEGLLTGGDRVYCPWHHASFHVCNGSLAEPPARDGLARFDTEVDGEDVLLSLPEEPQSARRPEMAGRRKEAKERFVIIGGGAAGNAAAQALREEGFAGAVTMITADDRLPYDRPNLSKAFLDGTAEPDWMPLRDEQFYADYHIEILLGQRVTNVMPSANFVRLEDGQEIDYDRLLLATGGAPRRLDLPGADLDNVFTLRSMADGERLVAASEAAERVVIIGGSFIGLECASSLRKRGLAVTVVEKEPVPFRHVLGDEVGGLFAELHRRDDVDLRLEAQVEWFEGDGSVTGVRLAGGDVLPADLVIVGVGVRPVTGYLQRLEMEADGGVRVNEHLAATPHIFAAGDIAAFPDRRTGERHRIEHWRTAEQQGRIAARNMAGQRTEYTAVPFFWTNQAGVKLAYVGHAARWDRCLIDGRLDDREFLAFYLREDRVLAVAGMGRGADMLVMEELMRVFRLPSGKEIETGISDFRRFLP